MNNSEKIPMRVIAAIIATGLMSFCGVIVETAMNVTFPILMKEFSVTTNVVQWMTSIYLLTVAIIVPLSAVLKSSYKTKTLFILSNLLFIIGVIIDATAINFGVLLFGRSIQGIGTGIALPLMFNIIMEQVPISKIGLMMGFGNLITGIAPAVGPTFGGIIANQLNWRWIYYILLPILIIALILGIWGIQQKSVIRKYHTDIFSLILIVLIFSGLVVGFSNFSTQPFMSLAVAGALAIGIISLILLVWRSINVDKPILKLQLFKNKYFAGQVIGFFLTQIISLGLDFLLPNYVQLVNGNSTIVAGLVFIPAGFAGAILAPLGGQILDRYGARKPTMLGISFCLVSLIIFTVLGRNLNNVLMAIIYVLYMAGMGMSMSCVMTNSLQTINKNDITQGNAILNTLQQFAGAMGTSLVAMVVTISQTKLHVSKAISTAIGTQHAFGMLTIIAIVVWIVYLKFVKNFNND